MAKKTKNIKKTCQDSDEFVIKLEQKIKTLEAHIRKLKSENKTLSMAWIEAQSILRQFTDHEDVVDIVNNAKANKTKIQCPRCDKKTMNKVKFMNFYVITCTCGYGKRVDDN